MEKEFIPYAEALVLKELGFDEPCFGLFYGTSIKEEPEFLIEFRSSQYYVGKGYVDGILAPLYQQTFRWFREKYGYDVSIKKRKFEIQKLEVYGESDPDYYFIDFPFDSYEEAELECLKKLIEIVKRKK